MLLSHLLQLHGVVILLGVGHDVTVVLLDPVLHLLHHMHRLLHVLLGAEHLLDCLVAVIRLADGELEVVELEATSRGHHNLPVPYDDAPLRAASRRYTTLPRGALRCRRGPIRRIGPPAFGALLLAPLRRAARIDTLSLLRGLRSLILRDSRRELLLLLSLIERVARSSPLLCLVVRSEP